MPVLLRGPGLYEKRLNKVGFYCFQNILRVFCPSFLDASEQEHTLLIISQ